MAINRTIKTLTTACLLLLAASAYGQGGNIPNTVIQSFAGAPTGFCNNIMVATDTTTGNFYDCVNGVWTLVAGAGASGVVSGQASGVIPLGTTGTSITQQSHCNDGITTASTVTCTEAIQTQPPAGDAGMITIPGNTTVQSIPANSFGFTGPNSGSFTSYVFQPSATAPAATSFLTAAAVASGVSALTYTATTGSGNAVLATSPTLVTPVLGAATATSLLATGIVDGTSPITITTGTTANLGTTYKSGYTFNQEATAGTAVTYTLPATAVGLQYCVKNSIVSGTGAADTGVLTVYPPSASYVIYNGTRNTIGGGGTHGMVSGGAQGDAACFVAIDATDWEVYVQVGTWTEN